MKVYPCAAAEVHAAPQPRIRLMHMRACFQLHPSGSAPRYWVGFVSLKLGHWRGFPGKANASRCSLMSRGRRGGPLETGSPIVKATRVGRKRSFGEKYMVVAGVGGVVD